MNIQFIKPNGTLSSYIDRYWSWDFSGQPSHPDGERIYLPRVAPGVGLDFFIHHREPFVIDEKGKLPDSHLIFSPERCAKILPATSVGFIAIRFRAGMFKNFTEIPFYELTDHYPDMEGIWGNDGSQLLRRINSVQHLSDKVALLEPFLLRLLDRHRKDTPLWNHILDELYHHHDTWRLEQLAKEGGWSYRHFRRKFKEETGLTPKHFQRLARFHATLKPLLLGRERRYLSAALDNGYFDQTHFIKEFHYFLDTTPSEFLQENNFMSHFYYSRL
ncbi:MAG TPA: AraC family transcriptional regulator [Puia sp.]|nr:AraC family transcriptional regulator [Puia sp.]